MLSCTEFIPAYSELFKYIEEKGGGHDAVIEYWNHISDTYVQDRLGEEVSTKGLRGCWDYWSHSLNEEAADFTMELDEENNEFSIRMHYCPSMGKLMSLDHMEPYHDYCGHCTILYARVLEKYGIYGECDISEAPTKAKCTELYHVGKKAE